MTTLIVTTSDTRDGSIAGVLHALEQAGEEVFSLATDLYPVEVRLSTDHAGGGRIVNPARGQGLDLADVRSVWIRHAEVGAKVADRIAPDFRAASLNLAEATLWSCIDALPAFVLDRPSRLHAFPGVLPVLGMASELGLEIPATLVTNDPAQARRFCAEHGAGEGVVAKMVTSTSIEREGGGESIYFTTALGPEHEQMLDSLALCPMIFQARVAKAFELRLTYVGGRIFAAAIDSAGADVDWRRDPELVAGLRAFEALPAEVERAIRGLFERLGLHFGSVDLIVTPAGEFVFLELNTVSYFDFVEDATGLEIAKAVAELLLDQGP